MFSLIQNKNLRYSLPILPAAAIARRGGSPRAPGRPAPRGRGPAWRWARSRSRMAAFALPPSPRVALFLTPPSSATRRARRTGSTSASSPTCRATTGGTPATVAVVPNYNFLSASTSATSRPRRRLPLEIVRAWDGAPLGVDWAVLKTGSQGPSFSTEKAERIVRAFAEDPLPRRRLSGGRRVSPPRRQPRRAAPAPPSPGGRSHARGDRETPHRGPGPASSPRGRGSRRASGRARATSRTGSGRAG